MKKKKKLKDLPLYRITATDIDNSALTYISLVKRPAIEVEAQYFDENNGIEIEHKFKAINDKQIIVGPAMIANKKIYRITDSGFEYQVEFTPEVIEALTMKFFRDNGNRAINFDHSDRVVKGYIYESSIVKSTVYSAAKGYGYDLPVGSLFIGLKIDDPEIWNIVKEKEGLSFSVEGFMDQVLVNMCEDKMEFENQEGSCENCNHFGDQGKYINSTPPCHPECKCKIIGNTWKVHPDPENGFPCKICTDNRKAWLADNANKKTKGFSNEELKEVIWNQIKDKY